MIYPGTSLQLLWILMVYPLLAMPWLWFYQPVCILFPSFLAVSGVEKCLTSFPEPGMVKRYKKRVYHMLHKNKKNLYTISIWEDSFDFMIKKLTFTMAAMLSEQSEFYYSGVQRKKAMLQIFVLGSHWSQCQCCWLIKHTVCKITKQFGLN